MNNQLMIKVYEVDYEFIIKNYLDKSLWKKIWNLFVYKDNVFTLNLAEINTKEEKIYFEISFNKLSDKSYYYSRSEKVLFSLNNMTVKMLKREINGAIFRLAERLDEADIEESDGYRNIRNSESDEEDALREFAEDFLNDEGVSNADIREVYIDNYVSENKTIDEKLKKYKEYSKYNYQTELLLMICQVTKDKVRELDVINNIHNDELLKELQNEVEEYMSYTETEEWCDEMRANLCGI